MKNRSSNVSFRKFVSCCEFFTCLIHRIYCSTSHFTAPRVKPHIKIYSCPTTTHNEKLSRLTRQLILFFWENNKRKMNAWKNLSHSTLDNNILFYVKIEMRANAETQHTAAHKQNQCVSRGDLKNYIHRSEIQRVTSWGIFNFQLNVFSACFFWGTKKICITTTENRSHIWNRAAA